MLGSFCYPVGVASSPLESYPSRSDVAANPLLDGSIRVVRTEGAITDPDFVRLGILRVLSQAVSGRDFLRQCAETFGEPLERSTFFDTLHSARRLALLSELDALLVGRTHRREAG